jgi:hypothetical protein
MSQNVSLWVHVQLCTRGQSVEGSAAGDPRRAECSPQNKYFSFYSTSKRI